MYPTIQMIRYMGNKNKLLEFIIPEIENITNRGDTICDLFSGTCSISYGLKKDYSIITNDIQYYSTIISKAIVENNEVKVNQSIARKDLEEFVIKNKNEMIYRFFYDEYSFTYFNDVQCLQIDSLRYAIEQYKQDEYKYALYLSALMFAMTKAQATPGHFAQYLKCENARVQKLYQYDIETIFYEKCDEYEELILSPYQNKAYNMDYKDLFKEEKLKDVSCFYIDPPYTGEQYSRFYHLLETVCKYDNPTLSHKGLYRHDRFMSPFSYKTKVKEEFKTLFEHLIQTKAHMVLSYSNKGLIDIEELVELAQQYYKEVLLKEIDYNHSTQGKGANKIKEYLVIGKC